MRCVEKMIGIDLLLSVQNHALQICLSLESRLAKKQIRALRILDQAKRCRIHAIGQRVVRLLAQVHKFRRRAAAERQQQAAEKQHWPDSKCELATGRHDEQNSKGDRNRDG